MSNLEFHITSTYSYDGRAGEYVIIKTTEVGPALYALLRIFGSSDEIKEFSVRSENGQWLKPIDLQFNNDFNGKWK